MDTIYIEDAPGDTIAQIGAVDISPEGDIVIADLYLPRVRLYSSEGKFIAGQGRFGDGPFEYRRIHDLAMDRSGRVFVHSRTAPRTTILTPALQPDTVVPLDSAFLAPSVVVPYSGGVVQGFLMEGGGQAYAYRDSDGRYRWRIPAAPRRIFEVPYWASVASFLVASAGDTLIAGNTLLYPLLLYDTEGTLVDEFGVPPPSFRQVPEVERGAFAFSSPTQGAGGAIAAWLKSFTVIAGLHVVQGRWLVVSHGTISTDPPLPPWETREYALDLYDLRSGTKVLEDVPLPEGARVLGGGPWLHVLTEQPPQPWTVVRYDILPEVRGS